MQTVGHGGRLNRGLYVVVVVVVVVEKEAGATIPEASGIGNARLLIGLGLDNRPSSRLPLAAPASLVVCILL